MFPSQENTPQTKPPPPQVPGTPSTLPDLECGEGEFIAIVLANCPPPTYYMLPNGLAVVGQA